MRQMGETNICFCHMLTETCKLAHAVYSMEAAWQALGWPGNLYFTLKINLTIDNTARTWIGNAIELFLQSSLRSREHSPSYNYCSFCIFFFAAGSSLLIKDGQFSVHVGVFT